jgi:hypothetical protein
MKPTRGNNSPRDARLSPRSVGRGPAVRLILETLVADERRAAGPTRRPKQNVFDRQFQTLVGRDADGVAHAAGLQRLVDRRSRESGIGAERHALSLGLLAVDLGRSSSSQLSALETLPDRSFAARQSP